MTNMIVNTDSNYKSETLSRILNLSTQDSVQPGTGNRKPLFETQVADYQHF